ncbi:MAG: ComEC/Rec2 family competence protein [Acidobacteria bacterium]|nr:ComEC/Rec2 family competence protein [Acidobacteriota bacterium]MCI0722964.1 ComEC/Rec2 family competence protein [Acidobacteriota bacterium]
MTSPLFPVTLAFCAGILVSSWIQTPLPHLLASSAACLLALWTAYGRHRPVLAYCLSLLSFASLGLICPAMHQASYSPQHLRTLARDGRLDLREPCRITGICSKGSIPKGIGEQVELAVQRIENRFSTFTTEGKARLALYYEKGEAPRQPLLSPGDQIEVLAHLRLPKNFNNPGQFDYVAYLERQDVALVGTIKNELLITRLATGQGGWLSRQIQRLRKALLSQLDSAFGSGEIAGVMRALLLGDRFSLSPQVEETFRVTGIYHVLVVSGQHVAIMAGFLYALFRWVRLPATLATVLTAAGLLLYSALAEGQPSVVRATTMACTFLLALYFDRDRNLLNSLALAAWSLLLLDPFWLFDPGFELSFLAVLAIAVAALPWLRQTTQPWRDGLLRLQNTDWDSRCLPRITDFRIWLRLRLEALQAIAPWDRWHLGSRLVLFSLRALVFVGELLVVSFSIQLVFVVLMAVFFHRASLVSPFLNLLAVPLVGLLVPLGFLLLLLSMLGLPADLLAGKLCGTLAHLLLRAAEQFSGAEWGNFRLPMPPVWLCGLYFVCLILALSRSPRVVRWLCTAAATVALVLILVHPFAPRTLGGRLQLTALDVRQGDSLFLSFPDRSNLLVDGGGLLGRSFGEHFDDDSFDIGEQVVSPFLWSLGIRRVDALALTHAHHDHMSGLHALLNNFEIGELWVGENPLTPEYVSLVKAALRRTVRIRRLGLGDRFAFHSGELEFLNPVKGSKRGKTPANNDSLAFRLQFGHRSFLLTGDLERRVEAEILNRGAAVDADLLKVAHHGSRSSSLPEFLDRVSPVWALISVAEHSPFGHPHSEVLQRIEERQVPAFRTDRHGAIRVTTDGKWLEVDLYRDGG